MNLKVIMLNEKGQTNKEYILYDSIHTTFWKKQNYRDRKHITSCQGLELKEGVDHKAAQGNLLE